MSKTQQEYCKTMKRFVMTPPIPVPRPQSCCKAWLYDLVTKLYFELFMVVVICLNMVIMMIETYHQPVETEVILYWFHLSFILIFFIEFLLKIIALRKHYFKSYWNIVDFGVLVVSIIGLFLSDIAEKYFLSPHVLTILRIARVVRILSLIRYARVVHDLLIAFLKTLPALLNISLFLLVMWISFSIFGMFNFAYVKKEAAIDDMFNFETFSSSMICVFMITMSSSWGDLLLPLMNTPPDCDLHMEHPGSMVRGDCASPTVAIIFFSTHIILSFLLGVHLYIAVVLEMFTSEGNETLSDSVSVEPMSSTLERNQEDCSNGDPESIQEACPAAQ